MKAISRVVRGIIPLLMALALGGCLLSDGTELIPTESDIQNVNPLTVTPSAIQDGGWTKPIYSWTVGPAMSLTVVRTDSPNVPIWGLSAVIDIIASPIVHGSSASVVGATPQGSDTPLASGVEYRVNLNQANGQSYTAIFTVPAGSASLTTTAAMRVTAQPVATGGHTLIAAADGTVASLGANDSGQLGNGTATGRQAPATVAGLSGVAAVAAGREHSLALTTGGNVWAWGANSYGQLGNGTTNDSATPVKLAGLEGVIAIAAGARHSLALTTDGTVWAWGDNSSSQLGTGAPGGSLRPVRVPGLAGVRSLSAGEDHSTAVTQDGAVWTWGGNSRGQLGSGSTASSAAPMRITGP